MSFFSWLKELVGLDASPPRAPKLTEPRRIYTTMGDEAANLPVFNSCDEGFTRLELKCMEPMTQHQINEQNIKLGMELFGAMLNPDCQRQLNAMTPLQQAQFLKARSRQASTPRSLSSGKGLCTDGTDSRCVTPTPPPSSGREQDNATDGSPSDRASESVQAPCHSPHRGEHASTPIISKSEAQYFHAHGKDIG